MGEDPIKSWKAESFAWLEKLNELQLSGTTRDKFDELVRPKFNNKKVLYEASPRKLIPQLPLVASKYDSLVINLRPRKDLETFLHTNGFETLDNLHLIINLKREFDDKIQFTVRYDEQFLTSDYMYEHLTPIFEEFNSPVAPIIEQKNLGLDDFSITAEKEFETFTHFHNHLVDRNLSYMKKTYAYAYVLIKHEFEAKYPAVFEHFQRLLIDADPYAINRLYELGRIANRNIIPIDYHIIEQQSQYYNSKIHSEDVLVFDNQVADFLVGWISPNVKSVEGVKRVIEILQDKDFVYYYEKMMDSIHQLERDDQNQFFTKNSRTGVDKSTKDYVEYAKDVQKQIEKMYSMEQITKKFIDTAIHILDHIPPSGNIEIDAVTLYGQSHFDSNKQKYSQGVAGLGKKSSLRRLANLEREIQFSKDDESDVISHLKRILK